MTLRKLRAVCVVVALLAVPRGAAADTDLGQICFALTSFNDTFRCSLELMNGGATLIGVNCTQRGVGSYQIAGAGTLTTSYPTAGSLQLSFVGTHGTSSFGGNKTCGVVATLSASTLSGPVSAQCSGAATPWSWTSTMTFLVCPAPTAALAAAPALPAAGDSSGN